MEPTRKKRKETEKRLRNGSSNPLAASRETFAELCASADLLVEEIFPSVVEIRRELHRFPELGFEEVRTAELVAAELADIGISNIRRNVGGTGVVAELAGSSPGKTVAVRADMDALPIQEISGRDYGSQCPGKMHACGHDAHVAIALGTARVMKRLAGSFSGSVRFLFQPAEESDPSGESSGAVRLLEDGAMAEPVPLSIFALHTMPSLQVGQIGCYTGPVWAGADLFSIRILGKKTHGAYPHTGIDAIPIAAQAILGLQAIVSRQNNSHHPVVVTIGEIHGGERHNIIAEEVLLSGTVRTLHPSGSEFVRQSMETILAGITGAYGAHYILEYSRYAPVTCNDPVLAERSIEILQSYLGKENVLFPEPQMGAEDFAHLATIAPGFYFLLGVGNPAKGIGSMLHTSDYDIDEDALKTGMGCMCRLLLDQLFS